jgi:chorismate mutase
MEGIFKIIDSLEGIIKNAWHVPFFSSKVIVDRDQVLEILDRLRVTMPEELADAQRILTLEKSVMQTAEAKAEDYLTEAREQAEKLLDEHVVTAQAVQKSENMLEEARRLARDTRLDADMYADGVLTHMEMVLKRGLEVIRSGRDQLSAVMDEDEDADVPAAAVWSSEQRTVQRRKR